MKIIKNSKIGIGIFIGISIGVLIGGQPIDEAIAAGVVIAVIAIVAENMFKGK
jgi:uncharacterized membrane protein YgaE (UPF0421/DUF939 family)